MRLHHRIATLFLQGHTHVDLWKLRLDGSKRYERLTRFSDHPGYKASNPVVSDNGRRIAFQARDVERCRGSRARHPTSTTSRRLRRPTVEPPGSPSKPPTRIARTPCRNQSPWSRYGAWVA
jgi:hypothetical protein